MRCAEAKGQPEIGQLHPRDAARMRCAEAKFDIRSPLLRYADAARMRCAEAKISADMRLCTACRRSSYEVY